MIAVCAPRTEYTPELPAVAMLLRVEITPEELALNFPLPAWSAPAVVSVFAAYYRRLLDGIFVGTGNIRAASRSCID